MGRSMGWRKILRPFAFAASGKWLRLSRRTSTRSFGGGGGNNVGNNDIHTHSDIESLNDIDNNGTESSFSCSSYHDDADFIHSFPTSSHPIAPSSHRAKIKQSLGWTKTSNGDADACHSLDVIVEGIQKLKEAVQEGSTLDGRGGTQFSWKEIWCPELSWTGSAISKIEDASTALRRMKDVKRAMRSLSNSMDDAIYAISNTVVQDSLSAGLANLPDDVLAYIFELCHLDNSELSFEAPRQSYIFSSVSRRFRDIAINLPILWRDVTPLFSNEALSVRKARCRHNSIYVRGRPKNLKGFFEHIDPYHQWEGCHLRFGSEDHAHKVFEILGSQVQSPFNALKTLSVHNNGYNRAIGFPVVRSLSRVNDLSLTSWEFPNLTCLTFSNILPSRNMCCPRVTCFRITFSTICTGTSFKAWDFIRFRDFVQSMSNLESLAIAFQCSQWDKKLDFVNTNGPVDPLVLPSLTSLEVRLCGNPRIPVVSLFMDLVDTTRLTKLSLYVSETRHHAPWESGHFTWGTMYAGEWMLAVFTTSLPRVGNTRLFPAVTDLTLDVGNAHGHHDYPHFHLMFPALPNVQHLLLKLPDYANIDLDSWFRKYGGLRELRSMRIDEYVHHNVPKYTTFFSEFSKSRSYKSFEKLEMVTSRYASVPFHGETLEGYLGEKLVKIEKMD